MSQIEVFVVAAARTAIGSFGGSLKDVPLPELATTAPYASATGSNQRATPPFSGL